MTIDDTAFAELSAHSREVRFAVVDGVVTYANTCAQKLLELSVGAVLLERAAPGTDGKLRELLAHPDGAAWEVVFVAHDKPVTVELSAGRKDDATLLLGHVIPDMVASSLDRLNQVMSQLARSNRELNESNSGIQQLLRELQDKAEQTQQDAEVKSRLVSNLSHELRTPLHAILGLTQLLSTGTDGALNKEQDKQVGFIRSSAQDLLTMVNDVLDLGKLDAGQTKLRIDRFALADFLSSMRGVLRPLVAGPVELVIEDAPGDLVLDTDSTKLGQIIRNLVSNALKFTERGEVRVRCVPDGERLRIEVSDTGIGIAPEDQELIFDEYAQIDSAVQRKVKGTGLGLPLARRFAQRMGGTVTVSSEPGKGSTFVVDIPLAHSEAAEMAAMVERSRSKPANATSILVVEDDRHTLFLYEKYLVMAGFHVLPARTIADAEAAMAIQRPAAIVLDIMLEADSSWSFLAKLKNDPETRDIPVLVVTITNREDKARALGADEFWLKPIDQDRLLRKLQDIAKNGPVARVLCIDDDATSRYLIRKHLEGSPYELYEASSGDEGVRIARETRPNVILLDFLLERGSTAFDVIDSLKADPRMRDIPIIVVTSHVLDEIDRKRLLQEAEAVISKQHLSRELAINRIRDALRKTGRNVVS